MQRLLFYCLLGLIWLGLPAVIRLGMGVSHGLSTEKSLFIFYLGFAWSIALLVFLLETSRQQLFRRATALRSGVNLAGLALGATLLAWLVSPLRNTGGMDDIRRVLLISISYGMAAGYLYFRLKYRHGHGEK
ncbi:MAG: hypothetical protein OEZ39_10700 [Gammaproteobacteria bacterium]|nr:hypothetical protein [Gammaproteobacteria bacterium]MDH5652312.1 hypothetical protein [Gammaproteobacteria bacterium]